MTCIILVDLEGSSPQVDWGGNVVLQLHLCLRVHGHEEHVRSRTFPTTTDVRRPHQSMKAPEGTVVNCTFPAAVAARMQIGHFVTEIIYRAMADVPCPTA